MNRKLFTFIVLIGICTYCFFLFRETGNIWSAEYKAGNAVARPIFISDTDMFKELERPPVGFYHDKHTSALEKEGCGVCHLQDEKGRFIFKYPKLRDEKTRQSLMNSYHDNCIGCHRERAKAGKKSGAVTCGECHVVKKGYEKWLRPVELDHYLHYQHEKALEKKCELCHHLYNEEEKKLIYKKGTESSCRDCHRGKEGGKTASFRKAAHADCINCHMEHNREGKTAGPSNCKGCHVEMKQRTISEMLAVPRPERGQPGKALISIEGARMKGVLFDHRSHESYTRSCRTCHHKTLNNCKTCHPLKGIAKGNKVHLADAYHRASSGRSCVGCHESKKSEPNCAGCHHSIKGALTNGYCLVCHSGSFREDQAVRRLETLNASLPEMAPEVIDIGVLKKKYMPVRFPHLAHVRKLFEISNRNRLANYFHADKAAICAGCHHYTPIEHKSPPPFCRDCHNVSFDLQDLKKPRLVAAYHLQCINCHKRMKLKPLKCTDCHAEKLMDKSLSHKNRSIKVR